MIGPPSIAPLNRAFNTCQVHRLRGDSVTGKINEGLRTSQYALICFSEAFLERPWPESELAAALSMQNSAGEKRVLPLILNSKNKVLAQYPLIGGLAYREYDHAESIAAEVATLTNTSHNDDELLMTVEGVHSGKLCRLRTPKRASVKWLSKMAQQGLEVDDAFRVGPASEFRVRWVLVDVAVEDSWFQMPRNYQRQVHAVVGAEGGSRETTQSRTTLEELGVASGTVFHLYAVEDEDFEPPPAACYG